MLLVAAALVAVALVARLGSPRANQRTELAGSGFWEGGGKNEITEWSLFDGSSQLRGQAHGRHARRSAELRAPPQLLAKYHTAAAEVEPLPGPANEVGAPARPEVAHNALAPPPASA